tara:strand:+ start:192 stop:1001 length:810 start_codon:yes stop_codon:yes gene_type:complete
VKIAMCYSGNLRSYEKTFDNQNKNVISNNNVNDIFILTSDLNCERHYSPTKWKGEERRTVGRTNPEHAAAGEYFFNEKRNKVIYNVENMDVHLKNIKELYCENLKQIKVKNEPAKENLWYFDDPMDWSSRRKCFQKTYECHNMFLEYCKQNQNQYDLVVRNRFDLTFSRPIDFLKLENVNLKNKVFCLGGWKNGLNFSVQKGYFFDGFFAAEPETMTKVMSIYEQVKEYPNIALNLEVQMENHLLENDIEINFMFNSKNKSQRKYAIIR